MKVIYFRPKIASVGFTRLFFSIQDEIYRLDVIIEEARFM